MKQQRVFKIKGLTHVIAKTNLSCGACSMEDHSCPFSSLASQDKIDYCNIHYTLDTLAVLKEL